MELWRLIDGFSGKYEVSIIGRVRSKRGLLKPYLDSSGYFQVTLRNNGERRDALVHHLVAEVFLGSRANGIQTNHIDGNKENNRIENLEYVSPRENFKHAVANNLHGRAKLSEEEASVIRVLRVSGVGTSALAKQFAVHRTSIQRVVSGRTWRACLEGG